MTDLVNADKKEKESGVLSLNDVFKAYCRLDPISNAMDVELLPLSQSDKWLKEAQILDMTTVTSTDTGLCFFKFRKRAINYEEFLEYIKDLAIAKQLNLNGVKNKLQACTSPLLNVQITKKI